MKFSTWYEMSTRFVKPITYKYLLYFNKHSTTVWFCSQSEEITYNTCFFFTFYDTFLCISSFPGKCELSSIQNSSKKRTFELNWIFLFSSSNTLIILNYLLSSEFFNQRASFPKSNAIWKMNTHNFLRHVKTWNLRTLIGVFD